MTLTLFKGLKDKEKSEAVRELISHSCPRQDFFLMMILSILMAAFGFMIDSEAVIIGSTLIAPFLYPLLSLSLGIVMADGRLISYSSFTILKSIAFGILAATLVTWLFYRQGDTATRVALENMRPSIIYAAIAVIAGMAAAFAVTKEELNSVLPGIANSVALIPPIASIGVGIATFNWEVISNSILLFLINVSGIIFVSTVIFSLMEFHIKKRVAEEAIKAEEKEVRDEERRAKESS